MSAPRWRRYLCAGSLILNLVAFGLATGAALSWRDHHDRRPPEIGLLTPEGRHALWRRVEFEDLRSQRRAFREARAALAETLRADPFDRAAAERAMAELRSIEERARAALKDRLLDFAESVDAETRAAYFDQPRRRRPED